MIINKYAGRSFNDISQYPIMPWVGPWGSKRIEERRPTTKRFSKALLRSKSRPQFEENENDGSMSALFPFENEDYNNDMAKPRNLKLHSGRLTKAKDDYASEMYKEGVNEFETQIYGDSDFHLKFGYSNMQITLSHLVR